MDHKALTDALRSRVTDKPCEFSATGGNNPKPEEIPGGVRLGVTDRAPHSCGSSDPAEGCTGRGSACRERGRGLLFSCQLHVNQHELNEIPRRGSGASVVFLVKIRRTLGLTCAILACPACGVTEGLEGESRRK